MRDIKVTKKDLIFLKIGGIVRDNIPIEDLKDFIKYLRTYLPQNWEKKNK